MVIYPVKHVSWDEVVDWSFRLGNRVMESGFRADAIVAVGRGGYVVSRMLSDLLDVDKVIALPIRWVGQRGRNYLVDLIKCFHRFRGAEVAECIADVVKGLRVEIAVDVEAKLMGLNVLAVEEISATGMHLAKAREILHRWGAREVRTATLVWKRSTATLRPNYIFIETPSFVWFQFPWSRLSDYTQFALALIEENLTKNNNNAFSIWDIEKLFIEWYGFKPERRYLVKALDKLAEKRLLRKIDVERYATSTQT